MLLLFLLFTGLVYSVIAPLILIFMIITFSLFWVVIKNNLLYVVRTGNVDGGGLFFPSAINQMFTGLYFMEICLVGLFFLVRDANDKVACEAQGVVMVAVLILTVFYQIWLNVNFQSLYRYAPVRLGTEAAKRDREAELEHLISADQTTESPAPMVNDSKEYLTPMEEKPRADLASNEDVPMRLRPRTDTTTTCKYNIRFAQQTSTCWLHLLCLLDFRQHPAVMEAIQEANN